MTGKVRTNDRIPQTLAAGLMFKITKESALIREGSRTDPWMGIRFPRSDNSGKFSKFSFHSGSAEIGGDPFLIPWHVLGLATPTTPHL